MTETTEPWAAFYSDSSDLDLLPGPLAQLRRFEAAERADQERLEAERQERADNRQQLHMWAARQRALAKGLAWDPSKPFEHEPDVYTRADALFVAQDAEQRRSDAASLKEAGLGHLIADLPHSGALSPSSGSDSTPPAPGSAGMVPVSEEAAHRYGLPRGKGEAGYVRLRLRRFLDRAGRTSP